MSIKINSTVNLFSLREFWDFTEQKNLKVNSLQRNLL